MNRLVARTVSSCLLLALLFAAGCTSPGVQDARQEGLEHRQDRMDSRTHARQERWKTRSDRQDARASAYFDAM